MPGPVFLWYIPYRKLTLYFTLRAPDGYFTLHAPDGQSLTILPKPGYNRNAVEIPSPRNTAGIQPHAPCTQTSHMHHCTQYINTTHPFSPHKKVQAGVDIRPELFHCNLRPKPRST